MSRPEIIAQLLNLPAESVAKDLLDEATAIAQLGKAAGNKGSDAELAQWINFARDSKAGAHLDFLNGALAERSYLVDEFFGVADAAVFHKLHADGAVSDLSSHAHVRRWFSHVQALVRPGVLPVASFADVALPPLVVAPVAPAAKETKEAPKDAPPAPPAAEKAASDMAAPKGKDAAPKEAAKEAPKEAVETVDPSKLDIRVGHVVRCWDHPDSDKLLCEEVDLGEGSTRMIASGIRAFYSAAELQGRKVLVLANLKERSIAGFKSQGMVLCACNADKSAVKLLEPPAAANTGDRVVFGAFSGEPATPAQVAKKKIFETLAPLVSVRAAVAVAAAPAHRLTLRAPVAVVAHGQPRRGPLRRRRLRHRRRARDGAAARRGRVLSDRRGLYNAVTLLSAEG